MPARTRLSVSVRVVPPPNCGWVGRRGIGRVPIAEFVAVCATKCALDLVRFLDAVVRPWRANRVVPPANGGGVGQRGIDRLPIEPSQGGGFIRSTQQALGG
jgi:hypothetical protein